MFDGGGERALGQWDEPRVAALADADEVGTSGVDIEDADGARALAGPAGGPALLLCGHGVAPDEREPVRRYRKGDGHGDGGRHRIDLGDRPAPPRHRHGGRRFDRERVGCEVGRLRDRHRHTAVRRRAVFHAPRLESEAGLIDATVGVRGGAGDERRDRGVDGVARPEHLTGPPDNAPPFTPFEAVRRDQVVEAPVQADVKGRRSGRDDQHLRGFGRRAQLDVIERADLLVERGTTGRRSGADRASAFERTADAQFLGAHGGAEVLAVHDPVRGRDTRDHDVGPRPECFGAGTRVGRRGVAAGEEPDGQRSRGNGQTRHDDPSLIRTRIVTVSLPGRSARWWAHGSR